MSSEASPSDSLRLDSEPPQARAIAESLHAAAIGLLRTARRDDPLSGLSPSRSSALSVVVYRGPLSISELAAAEQVRGPTMTRLVQGLEEMGMVRRLTDPADRRVIRVEATELGKETLGLAKQRRVELLSEHLGRLPGRELAVLEQAAGLLLQLFRPAR